MKVKTVIGILLLGFLIIGAAFNFNEKQKNTEQLAKQAAKESVQQISPDQMVETGPKVGKMAPNIELVNLAGEKVKLSDLRGKNVLINFWATWCGPCREEMPDLEKFYQEYKGKNFEVLAVNLTSDEQNQENIKTFIDTFGMSFPVVLDTEGNEAKTYQIYYIPTSYFVNTEGIITLKTGPLNYEQMKKFYHKAFNED